MASESPIEQRDNWFRGEDKAFRYTVVDADSVAVNITGWALSWKLYRSGEDAEKDADPLISKATGGSGIALTTPTSGILTVTVARADTEDLRAERYFYVLRRTDSGSNAVIAYGQAVLRGPF